MLNECHIPFWFWLHRGRFLNHLYACLVAFFGLYEMLLDVVYFWLQLHIPQDVVYVCQLLGQLHFEVIPRVFLPTRGRVVNRQAYGFGGGVESEGEYAACP